MKRLITAIPFGITLLTACSTVPGGPAVPVYVDTAEVIKAEPLYQLVQVPRPVNECWTETVAHASPQHQQLRRAVSRRDYRWRARQPAWAGGGEMRHWQW